MLTQEIVTYALGISALLSIIYNVYNSVKKPQEKSEIFDATISEKLSSITNLFAERLNNITSSTDNKINNVDKLVTNLRDNHLHTLDIKLDGHIAENQLKSISDAKWQSRVETLLEQLNKK